MSCKDAVLLPSHVYRNMAVAGLFILALLLTACEKKEEAAKPGPPEVGVMEPLQQDVPVFEEWVAQLNGPVNAEITPKVQGYLLRQNYQNGYFVKKGQLLFDLDPRQYQAAVDQSKADVAVAEANLVRVQADVARDTPLAAQSAIPQKQLDNDVAEQASWEAQLKAKKAALQNAELNLGWTKVYSPIDGIAGVSNAQVGDLVGTATKMTTVSQVNPIWAYFNISESKFLDIAPNVTQIITGKASISSLHSKPIEYIQANNITYPAKGEFISRLALRRERFKWRRNSPIPTPYFVPAVSDGFESRPERTRARCWSRRPRLRRCNRCTCWPSSLPTTRPGFAR
jgi:membrane fusion protein (multidrug efflux system)